MHQPNEYQQNQQPKLMMMLLAARKKRDNMEKQSYLIKKTQQTPMLRNLINP